MNTQQGLTLLSCFISKAFVFAQQLSNMLLMDTSTYRNRRGYILHSLYAKKFFAGVFILHFCISDFLYVRGILYYIVFAVYVAVILYSLYVRRLVLYLLVFATKFANV